MNKNEQMIENLKKGFSGSNDYLSGVNDGMYALLRELNDLPDKRSELLRFSYVLRNLGFLKCENDELECIIKTQIENLSNAAKRIEP
jgi:hypothetical protein